MQTKTKLLKIALISTIPTAILISPAFALTGDDLVSAGSIWLAATIAIGLSFITAMAVSLQIARGYFVRILNKFSLRLGADIWWLSYVLIRDALIFASFVVGLLVFFPGTYLDYDIAVPFMPVAVVLFGLALLIKLYFDADDNKNAFRAVTLTVFAGTVLWIFGTVFVLETPLALEPLPASISADTGFWAFVFNTFSSKNNIDLALTSFQVCFAALGIMALLALAHPLLRSRLPKTKQSESSPSAP